VEKVLSLGKPVIFCMMSGSAMDMRLADEKADAVLQLWYPGARGGKAVAKILFGEVSPSGKLPLTFYQTSEELPDFEDYSMKGRTYRYMENQPLYPFGYGLTYGKAEIVDFTLEETTAKVEVKNTGERELSEVVQIYGKHPDSRLDVRDHSLCGFQRVTLQPGEIKTVSIAIKEEAFKVVNEEGELVVDGKETVFYAGVSQPDAYSVKRCGTEAKKLTIVME